MESLQQGVAALTIQDAKPLTREIIDALSRRLNDDWITFARKIAVIQSHDIDRINQEFRSIEEKCVQVFKVWEQSSTVEVTIGMVKLILMQIKRNDILLDVFNVNVGNYQVQESQGRQIPQNVIGSTISALRHKHKNKLKSYLDPDHGAGIKNWVHVGHALCADDRGLSEQVDSLRLHYAGGGSPAKAFLDALAVKHPQITVGQFKDIAEEFERNDIAFYIRNKHLDLNKQLRLLDDDHIEKITAMLNKQVSGISDWRSFADEYGYSNLEIANMATAIKSHNSYSPTLKLIELLTHTKPTLSLETLVNVCERLQRRDVAKYVKDVIAELNQR